MRAHPKPNPKPKPKPNPNPYPNPHLEQNISSLLCQLPEYRLQHGHYYHLPFLCMGLFNLVAPLFQPQPQPEPQTRALALTPALTRTQP